MVLKSDQAQTKPMQDERLQLEMLAADAEKQKPTKKRKHVSTWNQDPFYVNGVKMIETFIETRIQIAYDFENGIRVEHFVESTRILDTFFISQKDLHYDDSKKKFFYLHFRKQMIAKYGDQGAESGWQSAVRHTVRGYKGVILLPV